MTGGPAADAPVAGPPPGPLSRALWQTLRVHEGPLGEPTSAPIVWARAENATVWDADGRAYTDLSSGFGVASVGHANPRPVRFEDGNSRQWMAPDGCL